jgi:small subunit ribosomal protein S16
VVKIRLMRMGKRKQPYFRVVVADSRSPRDGRFIENIGKYHPRAHPSVIDIDEERALHWLRNGAQPSDPVRVLLQKAGIWSTFTGEAPPVPAVKAGGDDLRGAGSQPVSDAEQAPSETAEGSAGEATPIGASKDESEADPGEESGGCRRSWSTWPVLWWTSPTLSRSRKSPESGP